MIPYENFSQLSCHAYFSYEMNLHLFDPILHNMVSERYHCADYEEEDLVSDIDEDEETEVISDSLPRQELTLSDVLEYATTEKYNEYEFMFGSFNSDFVPIRPIKTIQPKIEGSSAIKIGEIKCFFNNEKQICVGKTLFDLTDSELVPDLKCCAFSENVPPVFDHHRADFGIPSENKNSRRFWFDLISFTSDLNHSSLFDFEKSLSSIITPLPEMSVEHAVLVYATPQCSAFVFNPGGTGAIPPCIVTVIFDPGGAPTGIIFTTESHFRFVDHSSVWIDIFDPGGADLIVNSSSIACFRFAFPQLQITPFSSRGSFFVFDPGGNRSAPSSISQSAVVPVLCSQDLGFVPSLQKLSPSSCPHCFYCVIQS